MNAKPWSGLVSLLVLSVCAPAYAEIECDRLLCPESDGRSHVEQLARSQGNITQIETHELDDKQAATLFVRNIPVLTFVQNPSETTARPINYQSVNVAESSTGNLIVAYPTQASDPVARANNVAVKINQISRDNIDADTIRVRWNDQEKNYVIQVGEEKLVAIDGNTILPDNTRDLATDALQATNRLRRQVGNAPPLSEIEGRPEPEVTTVAVRSVANRLQGWASWYGPGFHGNRTANGERYNQYAMTAAHRYLPFGTEVRVTNQHNGRSVVVRINDRGPFIGGRIIDLSAGAAQAIGMISSGVAPVTVEVITPAN